MKKLIYVLAIIAHSTSNTKNIEVKYSVFDIFSAPKTSENTKAKDAICGYVCDEENLSPNGNFTDTITKKVTCNCISK